MGNILIFEDHHEYADELAEACLHAGHTAYRTSNLAELEAVVHSIDFDAAIIDINVYEEGTFGAFGVKAIRLVRSSASKRNLKTCIVIVTGSAAFFGKEADKLAKGLDADALIRKPALAEDVIIQVTNLISEDSP